MTQKMTIFRFLLSFFVISFEAQKSGGMEKYSHRAKKWEESEKEKRKGEREKEKS